MLFTPLLTAALETSLNNLLFRDRSMKAARQRLAGKRLISGGTHLILPHAGARRLPAAHDWNR